MLGGQIGGVAHEFQPVGVQQELQRHVVRRSARHPYTAGLLACTPRIETGAAAPRPIPGRPVSLAEAPPGCAFAARCAHAQPRCSEETPELAHHGDGLAACHRADEGIKL
ncbi:oligopeptide/dipeptide ABC transporter ATP-binding protein [Streptomyces sp. NPDC057908]|uniref:oligopeptide/dipeptide ABC transporter ATP-binding protein n=1 Tax=Streptomyces sp. NPDC057908 TaxID=3346276 RepID=UPI0036E3EEB8